MSKSVYFKPLIENIEGRSVESTVSMLGIKDKNLRAHLVKELKDKNGGKAFLADSVFESMFPWTPDSVRMNSLAGEGKLLNASLVNAMDAAGDHQFGKDWFPFKHQVTAWNTLLKDMKSVIVTSGTGSGKTECFMVPILNDLITEYEEVGEDLVGVRALFIYPLNALINSQRERLRAWTQAFDSGIKFCLYNGNTKENKHPDQSKYANEILTRKQLRKAPAPMLVTNATMLEYMLVRQHDAPIIEQSKGKLRWIVLDEAHTYIGSQAAELSLLLRRVLHTFCVEAEDVRFIATSATIGDKGADEKLQAYLANLAGVAIEQVVVIGGKRSIPTIENSVANNASLEEISVIEPENSFCKERYDLLAGQPIAKRLRDALTDDSDLHPKLSDLTERVLGAEGSDYELLQWLDIASHTVLPGPLIKKPDIDSTPFLPVRAHLFHQVMSGLWSCADKTCLQKVNTDLAEGWPFGQVYTKRKQSCDCGAPVFELVFCQDCNEPHLMAAEDSQGDFIQYDRDSVDEFSLDYEYEYEGPEEGEEGDLTVDLLGKRYIAPIEVPDLTDLISLDRSDFSRTGFGADTLDLHVLEHESQTCACCHYTRKPSPFRQSFLGTPFYISNTVPLLLESCQEGDKPNEQPSRGRRLITFTDSRQGTARISTKIQQDSERDSVRGIVYKSTVSNKNAVSDEDLEKINAEIKTHLDTLAFMKTAPKDIKANVEGLLSEAKNKLMKLGSSEPILWNDLVTKLQSSADIEMWTLDYYRKLNPELFPETGGARTLADMLLLREFARRPKRANSLETLGLVALRYPALDKVAKVPSDWERLNLDLDDWRSFLKVTLDFYIRENTILDIPSDWVNWMGAKVYPKSVMKYNSDDRPSSRVVKWPQVNGTRSNRMIRLLIESAQIDISVPESKDMVNNIMQTAWDVLVSDTRILKAIPGSGTTSVQLDRTCIAFSIIHKAWVCPITHRILDTTFKGLTPYLPFKIGKTNILCESIELDSLEVDEGKDSSDLEKKTFVRNWIASNAKIKRLRDENLWTDVSDKILEGGSFYRAVEHSAQQPASKLAEYESLFKAGKVNVMSCSTTMEMGVDIGGISVVAMNNVPPHPANYLQRAGRAGRRGETQALAFTICKDNPHERAVFSNPQWPFKTAIPAPYITFNSQQIIQRHINSLLISYFLHDVCFLGKAESAITLNCKWFFVADDGLETNFERFCSWLKEIKAAGIPTYLIEGLGKIKKGGVLANYSEQMLVEACSEKIEEVAVKWLPPFNNLLAELDKLKNVGEKDPYKRKIEHDLKRIGDDYLLSELASNAFLPGYGFPTGIATFDHYSMHDYKQKKYLKNKGGRIDNITRMKERPGRDLPIAIREYAPGSDVVIDGLSYRSAGILLNQFEPDGGYNERQRLFVEWRCNHCGHIEQTTGVHFDEKCTSCGADIKKSNQREFIEPLGFAVDFYSEPSTDISHQAYIPVQEPWVTAGGELMDIFNPRIGSYKVNSAGHIFHHSSGENDKGYAVCLRCGRAESMSSDGGYPKDLEPLKKHFRLQGKANAESNAVCEGSEETYAIKESVYLGASDQTDIFELYLKKAENDEYLDVKNNDTLMWTLAVALRQSLADIHGINAEELGYTVKADNSERFSKPVPVIALFDKCGGGAGFSSAAVPHLSKLIKAASSYLQCEDECDSACQTCLMGYDTRFHAARLNRHVALEYLDSISKHLSIPEEAKVFGEESKFCIETIDGELLRSSNDGYSNLSIFVSAFDEHCCVASSNLKSRCLSYSEIYDTVSLVLTKVDYDKLSNDQREDLWALKKFGITIGLSDSPDSRFLAQISVGAKIKTFGTDNVSASKADESFWAIENAFLVHTQDVPLISFKPSGDMLPVAKQGDVEVSLSKQCDGRVLDFGVKLWECLIIKHTELANKIRQGVELKEVGYVDSYITSPLSLVLFSQVIGGLKSLMDENWNHPVIKLRTSNKEPNRSGFGFYGEWKDKKDQVAAYELLFSHMDESLDVKLYDIKDLPHDRTLSLRWSDCSVTKVRFDHGMGYWSMDGKKPYFSFDDYPEQQVKQLFNELKGLKVVQGKRFPTLIFVKQK